MADDAARELSDSSSSPLPSREQGSEEWFEPVPLGDEVGAPEAPPDPRMDASTPATPATPYEPLLSSRLRKPRPPRVPTDEAVSALDQ